MKVTIWAVSDAASSQRGKTARVASERLEVDGGHFLHEGLNTTSTVFIRASDMETVGTGERGGWPKEIERSVVIELSAEEVASIVRVAVENGIIELSVKPSAWNA